MAVTATDAIVLQAFPYGETSRIVRLLTRTAGVHSAIARGALRPRSRYAVLEPFAEGAATLYIRGSREIQTLGGFDLERNRQRLGRDLLRFGGASLIAELVLRSASEDPHPELYDAVAAGLDLVMEAPEETLESAILAAAWSVIGTLGFSPELDHCIACGTRAAAATAVAFDYAAGGVRCDACAEGMPGRRIPPHARRALRSLVRGDAVDLGVTEGHWRLLGRYLDHHVLDGVPLRSLHFLATTLAVG